MVNNHPNEGKRLKSTRKMVIEIFQDNPDWNASQIHEEYLKRIANPELGVGLSAIQKHLEKLKETAKQIREKGLDQPWHFGLLRNHEFLKNNPGFDVSPSAISYIIFIQKRLAKEGKILTPRQVYWINKFHLHICGLAYPVESNPRLESLERISEAYADTEVRCKLNLLDIDTKLMDRYWFLIDTSDQSDNEISKERGQILKEYFERFYPKRREELKGKLDEFIKDNFTDKKDGE